MKNLSFHIPEPVRLKALSEGQAGEAWLAGLEGIVSGLVADWALSLGRILSGGTEAFVAEVTTADGRAAILKVIPPWSTTAEGQWRTLLAARGRGYAEVYRHDQARKVILLERLGPRLDELGLPADAQLEAICATLMQAWIPLPAGGPFMTGAEKAASLSEFIERTWRALGRPCSERIIDMALRYAADRRQCFEPDQAVLAHGDAHASNTLLVPGGGPRRFKFVDPDGLFIERAYDLGILMREWTLDLLAGEPLELGKRRCRRLAQLTGVAPEPIWRWGFIERVSTGLLCLEVGLPEAREMLRVADAWAGNGPDDA